MSRSGAGQSHCPWTLLPRLTVPCPLLLAHSEHRCDLGLDTSMDQQPTRDMEIRAGIAGAPLHQGHPSGTLQGQAMPKSLPDHGAHLGKATGVAVSELQHHHEEVRRHRDSTRAGGVANVTSPWEHLMPSPVMGSPGLRDCVWNTCGSRRPSSGSPGRQWCCPGACTDRRTCSPSRLASWAEPSARRDS